ncbi:hypothetical protein Tco_0291956 [Tanacetum coccineum]
MKNKNAPFASKRLKKFLQKGDERLLKTKATMKERGKNGGGWVGRRGRDGRGLLQGGVRWRRGFQAEKSESSGWSTPTKSFLHSEECLTNFQDSGLLLDLVS